MKWIKIIFISLLLFFSLLPSISFYSIGERETKNQNDANTGKDAGNVIGEAFSVEEGVYKGTLEEKDIDWYRFNVGYDRIIKIRVLSSLTLYLKAELIDKNNEVKEVLNSEYSNKVRELVYNGGKGSWFLKIQSVSGNGFYSFSLYTKVNVKNLVAKVSYTSLFETTNDLVNFGTRFSFTTQCDRAANYIYSKFSSFGLKTEYDNFIYNGDYYGSRFQGSILKNVIATKPGKNNTNNAVYIISAHYDSRSENADSSLISAPGADDDASSVAAVIETARILSEYEFDSTIKFIAFSGEEQWLQGSEHYAKNAKNRGENIKGVINYDMVSYKNKVDIVGDEKSRALVEFMKNIKQKYGISAPFLNINFYAGEDVAHRYWGSDHTSFQKYGYPAVVGFEASLDPEIWHQRYNPNYHKTTDTVDKLNFELLSLVTKLTLASLAELAENKIDELLS
ncbi:MAG: M20/M25/M40 family metallo-hydrolase, partial [Candidatus Thermoplasmatota archaeon]